MIHDVRPILSSRRTGLERWANSLTLRCIFPRSILYTLDSQSGQVMKSLSPAQRVANSLIWIVCGALVITIRALIIQSSSIIIWELLGGAMIVYGGAKLLWFLARRLPTEPSSL